MFNSSADATRLSIWACGRTSSTNWVLTGGTSAYFSVYAPSHNLTVSGAGSVYGAIVSKDFTASGGSALHYDKALAKIRTPVITAVSGSWAELPPY